MTGRNGTAIKTYGEMIRMHLNDDRPSHAGQNARGVVQLRCKNKVGKRMLPNLLFLSELFQLKCFVLQYSLTFYRSDVNVGQAFFGKKF